MNDIECPERRRWYPLNRICLSDNAGLASAVTVANCLFCFVFCSSSSQLKHESNLDMLEREKIIDGNLYLDSAGCRGPLGWSTIELAQVVYTP